MVVSEAKGTISVSQSVSQLAAWSVGGRGLSLIRADFDPLCEGWKFGLREPDAAAVGLAGAPKPPLYFALYSISPFRSFPLWILCHLPLVQLQAVLAHTTTTNTSRRPSESLSARAGARQIAMGRSLVQRSNAATGSAATTGSHPDCKASNTGSPEMQPLFRAAANSRFRNLQTTPATSSLAEFNAKSRYAPSRRAITRPGEIACLERLARTRSTAPGLDLSRLAAARRAAFRLASWLAG